VILIHIALAGDAFLDCIVRQLDRPETRFYLRPGLLLAFVEERRNISISPLGNPEDMLKHVSPEEADALRQLLARPEVAFTPGDCPPPPETPLAA
jgi:hypothetical protein